MVWYCVNRELKKFDYSNLCLIFLYYVVKVGIKVFIVMIVVWFIGDCYGSFVVGDIVLGFWKLISNIRCLNKWCRNIVWILKIIKSFGS